ncbi:MAG: hypothetical protein M3378_03465 [Actinomycetota bacterium]|nr:hypothetical protein [Actinomycetota bacterium]
MSTLREIEALQRRARRELRSFWFPLVLFGALSMASAPFCQIRDGVGSAVFWAVAGPAGGMATALHYRRRELQLGLYRSAWPYLGTAAAMLVGASVLPAVTSGHLQGVVSSFAVAAGYLVFAGLERSWWLVGLALVMVVVPLGFLNAAPGAACFGAAAVTGAAVLTTGAMLRQEEQRPG